MRIQSGSTLFNASVVKPKCGSSFSVINTKLQAALQAKDDAGTVDFKTLPGCPEWDLKFQDCSRSNHRLQKSQFQGRTIKELWADLCLHDTQTNKQSNKVCFHKTTTQFRD